MLNRLLWCSINREEVYYCPFGYDKISWRDRSSLEGKMSMNGEILEQALHYKYQSSINDAVRGHNNKQPWIPRAMPQFNLPGDLHHQCEDRAFHFVMLYGAVIIAAAAPPR